jgi:hypothetical protein
MKGLFFVKKLESFTPTCLVPHLSRKKAQPLLMNKGWWVFQSTGMKTKFSASGDKVSTALLKTFTANHSNCHLSQETCPTPQIVPNISAQQQNYLILSPTIIETFHRS